MAVKPFFGVGRKKQKWRTGSNLLAGLSASVEKQERRGSLRGGGEEGGGALSPVANVQVHLLIF